MTELFHDTATVGSLLHLASELGGTISPREIAHVVFDEVARVAGAVRCVVYERRGADDQLELLAAAGVEAELSTVTSVLPLTSRGQLVGTMELGFDRPHTFDGAARAFLTAVADLCAHAIDRAQLFHSERVAREHAERIAEQTRALELASREFSAALNIDHVAQAVLHHAAPVLGATTAGLWLADSTGTTLRRVCELGFAAVLEQATRALPVAGGAPVASAFRTGDPEWLESQAEYARRFPASAEGIRAKGGPPEFAAACLPLRLGTRALGAMFFGFEHVRVFTPQDRTFMQIVAEHAAQAIDRAQLFDQAQQARADAEAQEHQLRKLQALTAALASAPTMREVADLIVREARMLFAADSSVIAVGTSDDRLRILSTDQMPVEVTDRYEEIAIDSSLPIAIAYRTGQLFVAETVASLHAQSPDTVPVDAVMPARAAICARIPGEHGVRGAIGFAFSHERVFTAEDRQFLLDVANLASLALGRARLFESESEARKGAESALVRAQLADRRKDEFLAMLGHELRNPLAPIVTALELMKLDGIGEQRLRDVIERQVTHMTRLIDDLLDVSRITRGRIELARAPNDIAEILAKAIEQASPLLERNAHRLSLDLRDTQMHVLGDATRLAQVFANLMNNAAKYSPAGSQILVTARRDGERVVVTVRDHGIGIAPELLPHVFDVFMQAPQAIARSQGGLGLGLAIVKKLVEMHGGDVAARSAGAGAGSEFEVRLPLLQHGTRIVVDEVPRVVACAQASLQVLVVDDNQDAAEMLAEMLASAGHQTHVAYDGPSALQVAQKAPPDVALIDIGLPVMDGYELCRRFATLPRPPRLMVAITGYGQPSDTIRAREAGFHEHLVKPVDLDRIVRSIATIT